MTETVRYRKDDEGRRHKVVLNEGHEGFMVQWTDACTGCFEYIDGHAPMGSVWDSKSKCHVGGGCHECGYTGKVRHRMWIPFDITAWDRYFNRDWYDEQARRRAHQETAL